MNIQRARLMAALSALFGVGLLVAASGAVGQNAAAEHGCKQAFALGYWHMPSPQAVRDRFKEY